jgi:hypothetical protein
VYFRGGVLNGKEVAESLFFYAQLTNVLTVLHKNTKQLDELKK